MQAARQRSATSQMYRAPGAGSPSCARHSILCRSQFLQRIRHCSYCSECLSRDRVRPGLLTNYRTLVDPGHPAPQLTSALLISAGHMRKAGRHVSLRGLRGRKQDPVSRSKIVNAFCFRETQLLSATRCRCYSIQQCILYMRSMQAHPACWPVFRAGSARFASAGNIKQVVGMFYVLLANSEAAPICIIWHNC